MHEHHHERDFTQTFHDVAFVTIGGDLTHGGARAEGARPGEPGMVSASNKRHDLMQILEHRHRCGV